MMAYVLEGMQKFWDWCVETIKALIDVILSPLADNLPDMSGAYSSLAASVGPYLGFVNKWIALDWAIYLLVAYFVYIIVMISIKLIIKLFIPCVG